MWLIYDQHTVFPHCLQSANATELNCIPLFCTFTLALYQLKGYATTTGSLDVSGF